jgi:hypothetical protein
MLVASIIVANPARAFRVVPELSSKAVLPIFGGPVKVVRPRKRSAGFAVAFESLLPHLPSLSDLPISAMRFNS